jgi:hypothetical protein
LVYSPVLLVEFSPEVTEPFGQKPAAKCLAAQQQPKKKDDFSCQEVK